MNTRLIIIASTVASLWCNGNALTVGPVKNHHGHGNRVSPSRNVSLSYGVGDRSLVNATLAFQHPAVVLEDIPSVQSVNCSSNAIVVVFNSADEFASAAASWSSAQSLLFITNHLGGCDAELERGFFVSNAVDTILASLTIVAKTAKAAVNQVSSRVDTAHMVLHIFLNSLTTILGRRC